MTRNQRRINDDAEMTMISFAYWDGGLKFIQLNQYDRWTETGVLGGAAGANIRNTGQVP